MAARRRGASEPEETAGRVVDRLIWTCNGIESCLRDETKLAETAYRDRFMKALSGAMSDVIVKREAGVQGLGTKLDAHVRHPLVDFIFTVKKGMDAQKAKVLRGEIEEILEHWSPSRLTIVIVHVYACSDASAANAHLAALRGLSERLPREKAFRLLVPDV